MTATVSPASCSGYQIFVRTFSGKTFALDISAEHANDLSVYQLKQQIVADFALALPACSLRLLFDCREMDDGKWLQSDYHVRRDCVLDLLLSLPGGRLHGQVLQKSMLYLRPRGFMGMRNEKLHCLMMSKLVNTRQIHLLTLVKYFYARMALFHHHPSKYPMQYGRIRAAESQVRPFQFPRY